jgi:pilus assembly protein CpaE
VSGVGTVGADVSDVPMANEDTGAAQGAAVPPPRPALRVSLAVVEADPATRDRITALLGAGATPFANVEELAGRLTGAVPVVAVLGPSCANPESLAVSERIMQQFPVVAAVLMVHELTTGLLQQALRAGVRDVVAFSAEAGALAQSVQRVAFTLDQTPRPAVAPPPSGDIPTVDGHAGTEGLPTVDGQVITVFSTKGGSGKSVLATSLAVELSRRSDRPVCLVDADLQFGDVAVMLKLTPHHTIVDAVSVMDRLDPALLESLLVTHEPSGLRVMPAPLEPAFADQVTAPDMVTIIEMLRSFCSHVIVDTPAYFNDVVLGLVEVSDSVVLVAGMDIPNVKNVKIGLQTLRLLNTPMEKLLLVLNRANSKVKLDVGEVERTLQTKADVLIPSDVCVPTAVNKGEPVVTHAPKSGVTKAVQQLADRFAAAPEPARRRLR